MGLHCLIFQKLGSEKPQIDRIVVMLLGGLNARRVHLMDKITETANLV